MLTENYNQSLNIYIIKISRYDGFEHINIYSIHIKVIFLVFWFAWLISYYRWTSPWEFYMCICIHTIVDCRFNNAQLAMEICLTYNMVNQSGAYQLKPVDLSYQYNIRIVANDIPLYRCNLLPKITWQKPAEVSKTRQIISMSIAKSFQFHELYPYKRNESKIRLHHCRFDTAQTHSPMTIDKEAAFYKWHDRAIELETQGHTKYI